jgi:LmbE family N-acetylglucosaminyl deacetylase
MCNAEELSNFATPEIDSFAEIRRGESEAAAKIIGLPPPRFLGYPDAGVGAAWRNLAEGKAAEPLRRSDFSRCTSCDACGYGEGPRTTLSAATLTATLHALIAAAPHGALIATTHWLDGHPDHAALGNLVRRANDEQSPPHAVAYAVIHAHTKNTANADCWYPAPAAPDCPCMNDQAKALADPGWVARSADQRFRPSWPATLPSDAGYGEARQFCLPERLYLGEGAVKLRAIRAYRSQIGRLARLGSSHPAATDGIIDCSGYLTTFVRRTEAFVLVAPTLRSEP